MTGLMVNGMPYGFDMRQVDARELVRWLNGETGGQLTIQLTGALVIAGGLPE